LILAGCATPSLRPAEPPAVERPAPAACDPRLEAEVPAAPAVPDGASIVQPATVEEQIATGLHLGWVSELIAYAGGLAERARLAKAVCAAR